MLLPITIPQWHHLPFCIMYALEGLYTLLCLYILHNYIICLIFRRKCYFLNLLFFGQFRISKTLHDSDALSVRQTLFLTFAFIRSEGPRADSSSYMLFLPRGPLEKRTHLIFQLYVFISKSPRKISFHIYCIHLAGFYSNMYLFSLKLTTS